MLARSKDRVDDLRREERTPYRADNVRGRKPLLPGKLSHIELALGAEYCLQVGADGGQCCCSALSPSLAMFCIIFIRDASLATVMASPMILA
jgi:hypothetical protein